MKTVLEIARNCGAITKDGKQFTFYHGCELEAFAAELIKQHADDKDARIAQLEYL